jgi:NAD(P) transhydrogenase
MGDVTEQQFDLIVIGAGPAGEKGAAQAAYFGKRVALIEEAQLGGAVVNTGTLPSKTLRETALYLSGMRARNLYGVEYTFGRTITTSDLFFREKLIQHNQLALIHQNIERHGITLVHGRASFDADNAVRVRAADGTESLLRGEHVLIATGSRPARPASVPFDGVRVHDSDTILGIDRIPRSLIVVGGGVVGCEYATLFGALGVDVTLVDADDHLLPFLDSEISGILTGQMRACDVTLRCRARIGALVADDDGVRATLNDDEVLRADMLLYAIGRQGNTDGLGLERIGIAPDARGRLRVDEHYRTEAPGVLAAGDVIGFPALASTSMEQARVAVCQAFGFTYKRQVSSLIPYGLYTIPEVSMVGESEDGLRAAGRGYLAGRAHYAANPRAQIIGDSSGMLKLLFEPESRKLLGVHIIGERASELIHIGQMCMQFGGTIDVFIDNVFNFPTIADAYKYAAYDGLQMLQRERSAAAG